jgi:DNA-binding PadR family transcriptional regulator
MHGYHRCGRHDRDERGGRHAPGDWGGRFGGRHGRHGGWRGGRVFDHGDLKLLILQLISEKPRHGYELIKAIEEQLDGSYSPSPGVVYPTLTMLEELGHATVAPGDGGKKLYTVTPEGTAFLEANRSAVEAVFARMREVGAAYGGGPAPQILRAMENLRMALRIRIGRGPLTDDQVRAITAALDGAATSVEQS